MSDQYAEKDLKAAEENKKIISKLPKPVGAIWLRGWSLRERIAKEFGCHVTDARIRRAFEQPHMLSVKITRLREKYVAITNKKKESRLIQTISSMNTKRTRERLHTIISELTPPKERLKRQFRSHARSGAKTTVYQTLYSHQRWRPGFRLEYLSQANPSQKLLGNPHLSMWEEKSIWVTMHNKKPRSKTLELSDTHPDYQGAFLLNKETDAKTLFKTIELKGQNVDQAHKVYKTVRKMLLESMNDKARRDVSIYLLVERIARSAAYLQIMEQGMLEDGTVTPQAGTVADPYAGYHKIQREHRECLYMFVNLIFVKHKKEQVKTIEELRKTVTKEEQVVRRESGDQDA